MTAETKIICDGCKKELSVEDRASKYVLELNCTYLHGKDVHPMLGRIVPEPPFEGGTKHFCSVECLQRFFMPVFLEVGCWYNTTSEDANPVKVLLPPDDEYIAVQTANGQRWTMHVSKFISGKVTV